MSTRLLNQVTQLPFSDRSVRVATTATEGENLLAKTLVGTIAIDAPAAPLDNATFAVTDDDANASANPITVSGNGNLIDGGATYVIDADGAMQEFLFDRGQWRKISESRAIEARPANPRVNLQGPRASGAISSVGATAPITSTGGATPVIGITAATTLARGSFAAADKAKLDGIQKQGATTPMPALDIDWSLSGTYSKTLAAGANALSMSNTADGKSVVVVLTSDGGGSTVTWTPDGGTTIVWAGGTPPVQTATGVDVYSFVRVGTVVYGSVVQAFA